LKINAEGSFMSWGGRFLSVLQISGLMLLAVSFNEVAMSDSKTAHTQDPAREQQARDPRLHEGKMFVVKLVPAGKSMEILITGKTAAQVKMTDVGLAATMYVGKKEIVLSPKRKSADAQEARFQIEDLQPERSNLKLRIQRGAEEEIIEIPRSR
jgi:hypothetical protein